MERRAQCVFCQRSEETKTTGNLLTEDKVTAHYKCMLYSAKLISRDSPRFGDLCGFRAEDVEQEVIRGKRLVCWRCCKKVATVGCEVPQCKKSYHYPCAIEDGAKRVNNDKKGTYVIYCLKHYKELKGVSVTTDDPQTSSSLTNAEPPSKRTASQTDDGPGDGAAKRRRGDDSASAGEVDADMAMYAPLESDMEESENSEQRPAREVAVEPVVSPQDQQDDENPGEDDAAIYSPLRDVGSQDDDSQSLLLPVEVCFDTPSSYSEYSQLSCESPWPTVTRSETKAAGSGTEDFRPVQNSAEETTPAPPPPPFHTPDRPCSSAMLPPPNAPPRPRRPASPPAPEPGVNAAGFWRSCNAAGCTRAVFQDFFNQMSDVAERIWSDGASDEDYDLALSVLAASGNLAAYVAKQQEALQKKQQELQKASAAMMDAVTALKKRPSAAEENASL